MTLRNREGFQSGPQLSGSGSGGAPGPTPADEAAPDTTIALLSAVSSTLMEPEDRTSKCPAYSGPLYRFVSIGKLLDLLLTRELVLCQLGGFQDKNEGKFPIRYHTAQIMAMAKKMAEKYGWNSFKRGQMVAAAQFLMAGRHQELLRLGMYVNCWFTGDVSRADGMWKRYGAMGGCIHSSVIRLHQAVAEDFRATHYCGLVEYVDHETYMSDPENACGYFRLKGLGFSKECEYRIALVLPQFWPGTEAALDLQEYDTRLATLKAAAGPIIRAPVHLETLIGRVEIDPKVEGCDRALLISSLKRIAPLIEFI